MDPRNVQLKDEGRKYINTEEGPVSVKDDDRLRLEVDVPGKEEKTRPLGSSATFRRNSSYLFREDS